MNLFKRIYLIILILAVAGNVGYLIARIPFSGNTIRDGNLRYRHAEGGLAIYRYKSTTSNKDYVIEEEYNGESILELMDFSFADSSYLETLHIGKNVVRVSEWALTNCANLKSITVAPDNPVYYADDGVLYKYVNEEQKLSELVFYPNSRNVVKTEKGKVTQGGEFTIPDGVVRICANAFWKCVDLWELKFSTETNLITIDDGAFHKCSGMAMIAIPEGVTYIGIDTFSYCDTMEGVLVLPSTLTEIRDYAFFSTSTNVERVEITGAERTISFGKEWLPKKQMTAVGWGFIG